MGGIGVRDIQPDLDARSLRETLSRPAQVLALGFVRPAEHALIDAARASADPVAAAASLAKAASELLAECDGEIVSGNGMREVVPLVASLGHLCATLRLDIDGTPFSRICRRLLGAGGREGVHAVDLFQVLRTAGHYEARRLPPDGERIPWGDLLDDPDRGVRTLAAQVVVRLDPSSAIARLPSLLQADVNEGLLAHDILTALGEPSMVATATAAGPGTSRMLVSGLREAGHDGPAHAIEERMAEVVGATSPRPPERFDTRRLVLRRATPDDAEALFAAYASDPEVARYMTWRVHPDPGVTREFLLAYDELWEMGLKFLYVLHGRDDPTPFGVVDMRPKDDGMEFGYALARSRWGRGLMPEAVKALVEWCLAQPGIVRVSAFCDVDNVASARTMVKAGMSLAGTLPRHAVHPNVGPEARDCLLHELRRPLREGDSRASTADSPRSRG